MRRRSERKKSTDVPPSPAQPQRRSTRRRKSPSFSETEKSDEKDVVTGASEAEQENAQRDSSEERSETRRSRGARNRTTPVKESPAKRKLKREVSPVAVKKIDVIPEEENGSLTEKVELNEERQGLQIQQEEQENEEQTSEEKEVVSVKTTEASEGLEKTTAQSTEVSTLDASSLNNLNEVVHSVRGSVEERMEIEVIKKSVQELGQDADADADGNAAVEVEEAEAEEKGVSKGEVVMVEESNDMSMMVESLREKSSPIATASPIAEQHKAKENNGDESNEATTATEDVDECEQTQTDKEVQKTVSRSEELPPQNDRHHLSRDNAHNSNKNNDNGRTRKRKWLTKKCTESQTPVLAISTKSLKNLIADVHPVPLSDVQLESSSEIEEVASEREEGEESPSPERERERRRMSLDTQDRDRDRDRERSSLKRGISKSIDPAAAAAVAATISASSGALDNVQRSPSPALNKTSNVLYITNLVRPFTVLQLKGLLARTGKIVEDGFWIDRIKSKCYVEYETEDEAIETRHALHGVRWPVSNPKCLNVEFGAKADMERAIESTKVETPKFNVENNKDNIIVGSGWSRERNDNDVKRVPKPVREWDVGKKESHLDRPDRVKDEMRHSRERDVSENRENHKHEKDKVNRSKGSRDIRSSSLSPVRKVKKKENEPPLRLLDDLFRKTKTSPCIYWLPLTPEQIAEKEAFRQKRIEEHKQRLKQKELERGKDREREKEQRTRGNERDRERDRDRDTRDRRNRSSDRRRSRSRDRRRY